MRVLTSLIIGIQYVYIFFHYRDRKFLNNKNYTSILAEPDENNSSSWANRSYFCYRIHAHASPIATEFVILLFNFDVQVDFKTGLPTTVLMFSFIILNETWGECLNPVDNMRPNLVVCRVVFGDKSFHIWERVAPLTCHYQDGVLMQFGSDKWIHLSHVAAEPEQPAGGRSQYQDALHDSSVGSLRGNDWQNDANHAENRRENNDW